MMLATESAPTNILFLAVVVALQILAFRIPTAHAQDDTTGTSAEGETMGGEDASLVELVKSCKRDIKLFK